TSNEMTSGMTGPRGWSPKLDNGNPPRVDSGPAPTPPLLQPQQHPVERNPPRPQEEQGDRRDQDHELELPAIGPAEALLHLPGLQADRPQHDDGLPRRRDLRQQ